MKIHITDTRMLQVMDYCIANKIRETSTAKTWCTNIGIAPSNIYNIRNGIQQFTKDHIYQCCIFYNVSPEFVFGFSNQMFRSTGKTLTPAQRIREALVEIEAEQKGFKIKKKAS